MAMDGGYQSVWKEGYVLVNIWRNLDEICTKSVRIPHHRPRFEPESDGTQVGNNIFLGFSSIYTHF